MSEQKLTEEEKDEEYDEDTPFKNLTDKLESGELSFENILDKILFLSGKMLTTSQGASIFAIIFGSAVKMSRNYRDKEVSEGQPYDYFTEKLEEKYDWVYYLYRNESYTYELEVSEGQPYDRYEDRRESNPANPSQEEIVRHYFKTYTDTKRTFVSKVGREQAESEFELGLYEIDKMWELLYSRTVKRYFKKKAEEVGEGWDITLLDLKLEDFTTSTGIGAIDQFFDILKLLPIDQKTQLIKLRLSDALIFGGLASLASSVGSSALNILKSK